VEAAVTEDEGRLARDFAAAIAVDSADAHPNVERELVDFVDGALYREGRELVEAHLESCSRCREDVDDLRDVREQLAREQRMREHHPRRVRVPLYLAAAAMLVVVVVALASLLLLRGSTGTLPATPVVRRTPWNAAVADARRSGRIEAPPVIAELRPPPDVLRAPGVAPSEMPQPSGVVVENDRPTFTWAAAAGPSVVRVFHDDREIARSPRLRDAQWTPDEPLPRGVTLTWQVEVTRGDRVDIIPSPPSPPSLLRVLDAQTAATIAAARTRSPGDHLLLGVLYARAGVQDRAIEELRAAHADNLAASVRAW
jgi:hypothetical protein